MQVINIDTSACVNIQGILTGHSFTLSLTQYEDDGVTPLPWAGTHKLMIYGNEEHTLKKLTLTESDGLGKSSNVITVSRTIAQNKLTAGKYYYELVKDIDSNTSMRVLHGTLTVEVSR